MSGISVSASKKRICLSCVIFLLFALVYFLPLSLSRWVMFIPLASLTLASVGMLPWTICLALGFSMLGDLMAVLRPLIGVDLSFICQMGGFMLAHVFYVVFFVGEGLRRKREVNAMNKKDKQQAVKGQGLYFAMVLALTMIVVNAAFTYVIPCAPAGVVGIGVSVYAVLISVMMFVALLTGDWIWGLGAVFFVVSDFILAWNKFVEPVAGEKYLIMLTYYAAQLILFLRTAFVVLKRKSE